MQHSLINYVRKVFRHFHKKRFAKSFAQLDRTSGFGTDGCGKECSIVGPEHMYIGPECAFGSNTEFVCLNSHFDQQLSPRLTIGKHVRMTSKCRITCAGNITIGNDVLFAPEVFVTDHNHGMNPTVEGGYSKQPLVVKDVFIGDGTWCGQRVCILPGVTIGKHCIIGAGSIVTHSIPDYSMAVGNPAKVIKQWNNIKEKWE